MKAGGQVTLERGLETLRDALQARGHRVSEAVGVHGGYQAIWRENHPRRYFGGSDPRKDGASLGY